MGIYDCDIMPSKQHESLLFDEIDILQQKGWRVLNISRGVPDAIAVTPDNKIVAIEILGRTKRFDKKGRSKGYQWSGDLMKKRWNYGRYDDILFVLFTRGQMTGVDRRILASEEWPDWWNWNKDECKKVDEQMRGNE